MRVTVVVVVVMIVIIVIMIVRVLPAGGRRVRRQSGRNVRRLIRQRQERVAFRAGEAPAPVVARKEQDECACEQQAEKKQERYGGHAGKVRRGWRVAASWRGNRQREESPPAQARTAVGAVSSWPITDPRQPAAPRKAVAMRL